MVKRKICKSLSEGLLKSFQLLMQDFVDDEVDVEALLMKQGHIFCSENSPGGIGFIEEFVNEFKLTKNHFKKVFFFHLNTVKKNIFLIHTKTLKKVRQRNQRFI